MGRLRTWEMATHVTHLTRCATCRCARRSHDEVSDVRGHFPGAQVQHGLDVRDVSLRRWSHRVCEVREVSKSHVAQVQQTPSSCQTGRACEVRDLSNPHVARVGRTAVKRGARQERQVRVASQ